MYGRLWKGLEPMWISEIHVVQVQLRNKHPGPGHGIQPVFP